MIIAAQSLRPELMWAQLMWVGFAGWAFNTLLLCRDRTALASAWLPDRWSTLMALRITKRSVLLKVGAVVFAAAVIYLWQIAADAKLISPVFFLSPTRTFAAFLTMEEEARRRHLEADGGDGVAHVLRPWVLASLAGVIFGRGDRALGPDPRLSGTTARIPAPAAGLGAIIPPAIICSWA